jgi:hypothetical protein
MVFHTPPPAAPIYIILVSEFTASIAVILPLIGAGPICLEVNAPKSAEVTFTCENEVEESRTKKIKKLIDFEILETFICNRISFLQLIKNAELMYSAFKILVKFISLLRAF